MSHDIDEKKTTAHEHAPWGPIGLLFLAHFVVDSQISFLSPLLPLRAHSSLLSSSSLLPTSLLLPPPSTLLPPPSPT